MSAGPVCAGDEGKSGIKALLTVQKADLASFLVDDRDRGLGEALGMLPARLRELPGEVPDAQAEAIELGLAALRLLSRPGRLAVVYDAGYPAGGFLGYGIVASVRLEDEAEARAMEARVLGLIAERGDLRGPPEDSQRFEGFKEVPVPPLGVVAFGARLAEDGWRFEVVAGSVDTLGPVMSQFPAMRAEGMAPVMLATFDLSALTPLATFAQQMAGNDPGVSELIRWMTEAGLVGPEAIRGRIESGHSASASVTRVVVENARRLAERWALPGAPLTRSDLALVPADATFLSISRADPAVLERVLEEAAEAGVPVTMALEQFRAETGVDLRGDVLGAMGGTVVVYTSESTGGGGPGSLVAMISLKDRARFLEAHDRLARFVREKIEEEGGPQARYVSIRSWDEAGVRLNSVSARGVPVPFELTYAVTDRWLIAGVIPQGVMAAVKQAGAGNAGIAGSPLLRGVWREDRPVTSITVMSTRGLVRSGFPLLSMLGSAISRGVASPWGERDAGPIVPLYADLARDARPWTQVSYWMGDAFVVESTSDRSMLVNLATGLGMAAEVMPIFAAAASQQERGLLQQGMLVPDAWRIWSEAILGGVGRSALPRLTTR
jgi:hypothetical protein